MVSPPLTLNKVMRCIKPLNRTTHGVNSIPDHGNVIENMHTEGDGYNK